MLRAVRVLPRRCAHIKISQQHQAPLQRRLHPPSPPPPPPSSSYTLSSFLQARCARVRLHLSRPSRSAVRRRSEWTAWLGSSSAALIDTRAPRRARPAGRRAALLKEPLYPQELQRAGGGGWGGCGSSGETLEGLLHTKHRRAVQGLLSSGGGGGLMQGVTAQRHKNCEISDRKHKMSSLVELGCVVCRNKRPTHITVQRVQLNGNISGLGEIKSFDHLNQ